MISILHDKDVWSEADAKKNPAHIAGTPKKAHYHALLSYKNPVSYEKVCELLDSFGQPHPQKCNDKRASYLYFLHVDRPEKYQYEKKDVRFSLTFPKRFVLSEEELKEEEDVEEFVKFKDVRNIMEEQGYTEYSELVLHAIEKEDYKLFSYLKRNSYFMGLFLRSEDFATAKRKAKRAQETKAEPKNRRAGGCISYEDEEKEDEDNVNSHQTD